MVLDDEGNGYVFTQDGFHPYNPGGGGDGDNPGGPINPQILCDQLIEFTPGGSLHRYGFDPYKENMPPGSYERMIMKQLRLIGAPPGLADFI